MPSTSSYQKNVKMHNNIRSDELLHSTNKKYQSFSKTNLRGAKRLEYNSQNYKKMYGKKKSSVSKIDIPDSEITQTSSIRGWGIGLSFRLKTPEKNKNMRINKEPSTPIFKNEEEADVSPLDKDDTDFNLNLFQKVDEVSKHVCRY